MDERSNPIENKPADSSRGDYLTQDHVTERLPSDRDEVLAGSETRTLPLHEEELIAEKHVRQVGEVVVRKEVEAVPGRLEVDTEREEVEILHVPVGQVVEHRKAPWQDGETYVMPIYEEQLALVKRLVLKEEVRVRRLHSTEKRLFQDTVRKERPVVEDGTGRDVVRERYSSEAGAQEASGERVGKGDDRGGPLDRLARRILD